MDLYEVPLSMSLLGFSFSMTSLLDMIDNGELICIYCLYYCCDKIVLKSTWYFT